MGGPGQKTSNKQLEFPNLLILVHLENYLEVLNKFLMCFESFLPGPPIFVYYCTGSENILLLKQYGFI